ncbi:MAG TPA: ABC transporter substrate binding protein, partial [Desulfobacteraceae bacterium]|nr:ABC transporter substrate binding protein [Desulfobacteraceae bacterium]
MLLNSYHKGFFWTDEITRGVTTALAEKKIDLHVEYMDTKRQSGPDYLDLVTELLRFKHTRHHYRVVITSDNNAFSFFKRSGQEIFGEVPLVFCGVNDFLPEYLNGLPRATGINEQARIQKNLRLIRQVHPECRKIVVVTDNTRTGRILQKKVRKITKGMNPKAPAVELVFAVSARELVARLKNLKRDTIVLFTLFFRDKNDQFFAYDRGTRMICDASPVPVYGTWDFQMGHGIVGGYLVEGFQQGEAAAKKTLEILSGKAAQTIPVLMDTPCRLCFDHRKVVQYAIPMERLPRERALFFQPSSFYHQYKNLIWITTALFSILGAVLMAVTLAWFHSKKTRGIIAAKEAHLRMITDNMADVICQTDERNNVIYTSPSMEKVLGFSPGEAAEKAGLAEIHPEDSQRVKDQLSRTRKEKCGPFRIQYRRRHANGHYIWAESAMRLLYDDQGKYGGMVFSLRDITEMKAYENQLLRFATVIDQID